MPPSPVNRMTDWCKNITLPQTSFAGGKNVVNSSNVNTFKDRLDKHWENQGILFNCGAKLKITVVNVTV